MLQSLRRWLGRVEPEPDAFAIVMTAPRREEVARVDRPLDPGAAEDEVGLEEGCRYVMREIYDGKLGGSVWVHSVGESSVDPDELREEILEDVAELLQESGGRAAPPIEPDSVQEAIQLSLLSDSSFVEAHGDDVVKWAFSSSESALGDPDVDLKLSSPLDLIAYRGASDPESTAEQLEGAAERISSAVRRGLRGAGGRREAGAAGDGEAADVDEAAESGPRKSPEEVAQLSKDLGGPKRERASAAVEDVREARRERELEGLEAMRERDQDDEPAPNEPSISEEEADRVADEVAEQLDLEA